MDNRYIGVFDSGIGGLTSIPFIMERLPNEKIIFFGDTARTPYGSKSRDTIRQFTQQIGAFLKSNDVKMMVSACNTISATSLDVLRDEYPDIPIVGVISPTVDMISRTCETDDRIGILATKATVKSGEYLVGIKQVRPDIKNVFQKECPLFVPLVEEGMLNTDIMDMMIRYYLDDFISENNINTLVLGCTHYPLLIEKIKRLYPQIKNIINSSEEVSFEVKRTLKANDMLAEPNDKESFFYASDLSDNFINMIQLILSKHENDLNIRFKNLEL